MKEKIAKEDVRQVLLDINPLVRQFHMNVIRHYTGIDPMKANELDLEDSIHFLKHVWGSCLDWGNQSIDYIGRSVQELSHFLASFTSVEEIHNYHAFLKRLEKYSGSKRVTSVSEDEVIRLTELLQKFNSVGIKTAALIMRFLCLDGNFFQVDRSQLIPPLDRVNYRMCKQLFGKKYISDRLGEERDSFGKKANMVFDDLGRDVLGKDKVLIDNLWFIGHFYHDRRKDVEPTCDIRKGAVIIDYPLLKNMIHKLGRPCPFLKYGCERQVT
jgi:hypothetical protein